MFVCESVQTSSRNGRNRGILNEVWTTSLYVNGSEAVDFGAKSRYIWNEVLTTSLYVNGSKGVVEMEEIVVF